jgi:adenine deaminase
MVRVAVALGIPPEDSLVMASFSGATWHRLDHLGAIAPGYQADLLLLSDLERFEPELVLKRGGTPGEIERPEVPEWVKHTVRVAHVGAADLELPPLDGPARVIGVVPGQIVTEALTAEPPFPDPERDIAKIAVIERHHGTGRIGLGLVHGFGLRAGAIATTISHDAHNIVVIGVDDQDMTRAVMRLAELGGGEVVVEDRGVRAELALPVAGLLSDAPLQEVLESSRACIDAARRLGCELDAPFQLMSFLALSVIPSLKITDRGLVDVDRFELVGLQA